MTDEEMYYWTMFFAVQENIKIQKKALFLLSIPGFHTIIMQNSVWYQDPFMHTLGGPFARWCPCHSQEFWTNAGADIIEFHSQLNMGLGSQLRLGSAGFLKGDSILFLNINPWVWHRGMAAL